MLDWHRILELRTDIGEEDFAEVAEVFLDELEEVIVELGAGGTPEEMSERLHFLKGCSLNLGFASMAKLASEAHRRTRAGDIGAVDLEAFRSTYQGSRSEFESGLT